MDIRMKIVRANREDGKTLKAIESLRRIPYGDQLYTGTGTSVKLTREVNGTEYLVYLENNKVVLIERLED